MDFAPTTAATGERECIVSWHDSAPKDRRFTIEHLVEGRAAEVLATVATHGTRTWRTESVKVSLTPNSKLRLRFEDNAGIAISQVELRTP